MDYLTVPDVPGFLVGRMLGRGGSSTVWLVTEQKTGRDFALKCLEARHCGPAGASGTALPDAAAEETARREILILSALDHQHLIKARDALRVQRPGGPAGPDGSGIGLLLDYAPGGSLGELVSSRGKLTIGETVTVLTPIAQALGYLHGRGFTHGDVSPGNVLFTGQGKPVLSDVGIARMAGDVSTVPDHGTAGFMDPTPLDAVRAGLQPERDVYSVAALGWYCLTGEPPRRTADRPPLSLLLPDVPADLAAVLESGLNEDRRLRPTATELATAVYRSAPPLPVDLASSVHPAVVPQLLTRRRLPERPGSILGDRIGGWRRRISTSRWSRRAGVRELVPFPQEEAATTAGYPGQGRRVIPGTVPERRARRSAAGRHAAEPDTENQVPAPGRSRKGGLVLSAAAPTRGAGGAVLRAAGAGALMAGVVWAAGVFGPGGPRPGQSGAPEALSSASGTDGSRGSGGGQENGGSGHPTAGPVLPAAVKAQLRSDDPLEAVRGLASVRSLAFSSGHLELLDIVNAPGSAAWAADARIKGELQASGNILAGFAGTVKEMSLEPGHPSADAVVRVTSATSSYLEKDRAGDAVAASVPGSVRKLRLVLVSLDGQWRITDVLPAS